MSLTVVLSQGQSHNPVKRKLEEDIVTALIMERGVHVTLIPNLYDLTPESTGMLALQGIAGNVVVLSWLYERAARWVLDRNSIRGQVGQSHLVTQDDHDDNPADEDEEETQEEKLRVRDGVAVPARRVYCLELAASDDPQAFVDEVLRIAAESATQVVDLTNWSAQKRPTSGGAPPPAGDAPSALPTPAAAVSEETPARRWYPVIDFSRCTNCMECIDFCLFGVYGVDGAETILVEQPDNCRKGCPACSRVCPENAIIFPQHKTPAIAGAPVDAGGLKIDLSKLFGAGDAVQLAAAERDEQLVIVGREAVGMSVGIPKRQTASAPSPKDELDSLLDGLDELEL